MAPNKNTKKVILVTGCSAGGIGDAIAHSLAKRGHHVFATARNPSKIPTALSSLPNVTVLALDVTSPASITEAVEAVAQHESQEGHWGLDVLVNNAGNGYNMPILDLDISQAQKVYDTNVWGPLRMVQAFSKQLIANKGRIVNVTSTIAFVNHPWTSTYNSSKAAMTQYSETLRLELEPFGVSVLTLMPGAVKSQWFQNNHSAGADWELPEGSRYVPIEETIRRTVDGRAQPKTMMADDFAESLVDDILGNTKPAGGVVYRAPMAGFLGMLGHHVPQAVTVSSDDLFCYVSCLLADR